MVSLSYLPKNQPPKIVSFTIEKEPSSSQKLTEAKADGKTEAKPQTPAIQKPHRQVAQKMSSGMWKIQTMTPFN